MKTPPSVHLVKYLCAFTLFILFTFNGNSQQTIDNVGIGVNDPHFGVRIKANFPGYTGGWARGLHVSNEKGTTNFITFGSYGQINNGVATLTRSFIGPEWNNTYMDFLPNGNVGIGSTAPAEKLTVSGIGAAIGIYDTNALSKANNRIARYANALVIQNTLSGGWKDNIVFADNGNVGIGTAIPKALLDVGGFIPDGAIGTVLGRLPEGDTTSNGTFLGVKGHKTQGSDLNNIKSFSLIHNFYGETNNSINFYRGGSTTGGFLTFNTSSDIERMRILGNGNVGIGTTTPSAKLDVNGGANFEGNAHIKGNLTLGIDKGVSSISGPANGGAIEFRANSAFGGQDNRHFRLGWKDNNNVFYSVLSINEDSRVGIGTITPTTKLEITSETANDSGLKLTNLKSATAGKIASLGVDNTGKVVLSEANKTTKEISIGNNGVGDYTKSVILLHEIYNGVRIDKNYAIGEISAMRGNAGAFNRTNLGQINTSSAYESFAGTVTSVNTDAIWELYTVKYQGKKYMAVHDPHSAAYHNHGFEFKGWTSSTGENMKIIAYETNGVAIANSGLSELQPFKSNMIEHKEVSQFTVNGNVGIGTDSPFGKLTVKEGNQLINFLINQKLSTGQWPSVAEEGTATIQASGVIAGNLAFATGNLEKMRILSNGYVGIGTPTPDELLAVNGNIHAKEVRVDMQGWPAPDYVFEKYYTGTSNLKSDYRFPSLEEVEAYTRANNHLPNVPSAKEIQENGLKLGEMNSILLQKVEELTLYLIQQNKEIESLKAQNKEIEGLKAIVNKLVKENKN